MGKAQLEMKKNQAEMEKWCGTQSSRSGMKVKVMLKGKHKAIEKALFLWYEHLRGKGLPVTGPDIAGKSIAIEVTNIRFRIYC